VGHCSRRATLTARQYAYVTLDAMSGKRKGKGRPAVHVVGKSKR
jgi:hypothetical protein